LVASMVTTVAAGLGAGGTYSPSVSDSTSVFNPASPSAEAIRGLFFLVLAISAVIFVLVLGALLYFMVRYRRRPSDDDAEPPQVYGSVRLEWAWMIGPTLIVFVIFLVVIRVVLAMRTMPTPEGDLAVTVIAHQWWWDFGYPEYGFHTANEMHVPVGGPEHHHTVNLSLESADVAHSFWVPRLAGKTDVIPGRVNHMFFEALEPGLYRGQCSEYCGMQHSMMLIRVIAQPEDEFRAWVANQQRPAVDDPAVAGGRALFLSKPCYNCHTIRGTPAHGTNGPDLTHLMSRQTLASGTIPNDHEHLLAWVRDPQKFKMGCKMPALRMPDAQRQAIVAYLETLK
jgi:cytochrome c oxidase subunit 2